MGRWGIALGKAYTIRLRGWRLWSNIAGFAFFTVFALLAAIIQTMAGGEGAYVMFLIAAGFAAATAYFIVLGRRYSVTVKDDAIEIVTAFRRDLVLKADVVGWTLPSHSGTWATVVLLHPKEKGRRKIEVPLPNKKDKVVLAWLDDLENLEASAAARSVETLLMDDSYGRTREERISTLSRERRIAGWLELLGLLAMLWIVIWPKPYSVALISGLVLPVIVFVLALMLKDRWTIGDYGSGDQRPKIGLLTLLFPIAILVRATSDYRVVDYGWAILSAIMFGAMASVLTTLLFRETPRLSWRQALLAVPFAIYIYGGSVVLNVQLDKSEPQRFAVDVIKSVADSDRDGKLTIAAWGPYAREQTLNVSYRLQQQAPTSSRVGINLYSGMLGIRWWKISPLLEETTPAESLNRAPWVTSAG